MTTWLIYALGGGWGHLNRTLALGRVAASQHQIKILTNSPYGHYLSAPECSLEIIPPELNFFATCQKVKQVLENSQYDCLLIDTFPRGLGGELTTIIPQLSSVPKVLIHRQLNPEYVESKNLKEFVAKFYDLVLIPGEGLDLPFADFSQVAYTNPWLIRSKEDLPRREIAHSLLKLTQQELKHKIIIILATGKKEELPIYGQLAEKLLELENITVRCISPIKPPNCPEDVWVFHYPAIECLSVGDIIVGSGGYNTIYEAQYLGIPLVSLPLKRLYDRQFIRIKNLKHQAYSPVIRVSNIQEAIDSINYLLNTPISKPKTSFSNGVKRAIEIINTLAKKRCYNQ